MRSEDIIKEINILETNVQEYRQKIDQTRSSLRKLKETILNEQCPIQIDDILKSDESGNYIKISTIRNHTVPFTEDGFPDFEKLTWDVYGYRVKKDDKTRIGWRSSSFEVKIDGSIKKLPRRYWEARATWKNYHVWERPVPEATTNENQN